MKICLKWAEIVSSTRKWQADTQEKLKTEDGDGEVITVDELRVEVGEDRTRSSDQMREVP